MSWHRDSILSTNSNKYTIQFTSEITNENKNNNALKSFLAVLSQRASLPGKLSDDIYQPNIKSRPLYHWSKMWRETKGNDFSYYPQVGQRRDHAAGDCISQRIVRSISARIVCWTPFTPQAPPMPTSNGAWVSSFRIDSAIKWNSQE